MSTKNYLRYTHNFSFTVLFFKTNSTGFWSKRYSTLRNIQISFNQDLRTPTVHLLMIHIKINLINSRHFSYLIEITSRVPDISLKKGGGHPSWSLDNASVMLMQ
jgi:hypothetical protein